MTRRDFVRLGVASGAGLGLAIDANGQAKKAAPAAFQPSALLRIDSMGGVTVWVNKVELGQGTLTSLPMVVADELGVEWSAVRVVQAPFDPKFGNQETRGSRSVRTMYEPLRELGATARGMLIRAAEAKWKVDASEINVRKGVIVHAKTRRSIPYGSLVAAASRLPIPREPAITRRPESKLVGTPLRRKDTPSKVDGSAKYPIDARLPGMLYACVARSPVFGAKIASVDETKARKSRGVKNVVRISSGVAVVADSTWTAIQGRNELLVKWEESPNASESSIKLRSRMDDASKQPGKVLVQGGPLEAPSGSKNVEAVYELGFQAHAPMEPLSCTARLTSGRCEVWATTQDPAWAQAEIKRITGLADSAIRINIMPGGGAFGRAIYPDHIVEAVEVAKAIGAPVKLFRQREDDMQFDRFRPASLHRMSAAVDSGGKLAVWSHHIVTTPIMEKSASLDIERFEAAGALHSHYRFPAINLSYSAVDSHVPRGCWRSTPHVSNVFAVEAMMDELAAAAGMDPLKFRLDSVGEPRTIDTKDGTVNSSRLARVLEVASAKAGWGSKMAPRQGRGIACHYSFGSYAAAVAEVAVDGDGNVKVPRFVVAMDCGRVVNPDSVTAQVEGSVAFGLTAALFSKITIENGKVLEANFNNNPVLRIDQMPKVETHLIPSAEPSGGAGEPVVPVIAPALCNALFAATGVRIRALPVRTRLLRQR